MQVGDYVQTTKQVPTSFAGSEIPVGARGEVKKVKDGWAYVKFHHKTTGYFPLREDELAIIVKGVND